MGCRFQMLLDRTVVFVDIGLCRKTIFKKNWVFPALVAGKTVISLTRAIPEHIRGGCDDALYKSTFTLLYTTWVDNINTWHRLLKIF